MTNIAWKNFTENVLRFAELVLLLLGGTSVEGWYTKFRLDA